MSCVDDSTILWGGGGGVNFLGNPPPGETLNNFKCLLLHRPT